MAEKDKADEQKTEEKGSSKLIIFILGGVIVLALVAFVVVKFVMAPSAKKDTEIESAAAGKPIVKLEEEVGFSYGFDKAVIVNIAETNGLRYLKANLQLKLSDEELKNELDLRAAQVLDLIISVLSSKTLEDIQGTVNRNRIRRELIDRLNAVLITGKVIDLYFTEYLVT